MVSEKSVTETILLLNLMMRGPMMVSEVKTETPQGLTMQCSHEKMTPTLTLSISMSDSVYVCVCVFVRGREREGERERLSAFYIWMLFCSELHSHCWANHSDVTTLKCCSAANTHTEFINLGQNSPKQTPV